MSGAMNGPSYSVMRLTSNVPIRVACMSSLLFRTAEINDLFPLHDFRVDKGREFVEHAGPRQRALHEEALAGGGGVQYSRSLLGEAARRILRRAGRQEHPGPAAHVVARHPGFRDRR